MNLSGLATLSSQNSSLNSIPIENIVATAFFVLAMVHTFSTSYFQKMAHKYRQGSVGENLFHLLGEVEVVFGFWAGLYVLYLAFAKGGAFAHQYLESINFTEPLFVFVILAIASTRPVLFIANRLIEVMARLLPFSPAVSVFISALVVGPLIGSFITEPAAMTITAIILFERYYTQTISNKLKYATLATLFVNISIGGTLTHFAAPPVLMVAAPWNWDTLYMLEHFGWKAALAVVLNTALLFFMCKTEILTLKEKKADSEKHVTPIWVIVLHLVFLAAVVASAHYVVIFMGLFLFFIGLHSVTQEYQSGLKLKQGLLVAFFLGGLVILGGPQKWWLQPLVSSLDSLALFAGATLLTAVTDNAALTYLGAQVEGLSEFSKYALVAGAVTGGGLTVIANAPNPIGFSILQGKFVNGVSPLKLLGYALLPTLVAALCFYLLPTIG